MRNPVIQSSEAASFATQLFGTSILLQTTKEKATWLVSFVLNPQFINAEFLKSDTNSTSRFAEWLVSDARDFSLFHVDDYKSPLWILSDQIPQQIFWSIAFQPEPQ